MLNARNMTRTYISGDLELILKKRDAADHQFFRLEDGNLVVKDRFLIFKNSFFNNSNCFESFQRKMLFR